nr:hypothetical protein GCM10020093_073730 [Planobispora longispora]
MAGAQVDAGAPGAEELMAGFLDAVAAGVGAEPVVRNLQTQPWLYAAAYPGYGDPGNPDMRRFKIKAAYLRKGYTDRQIEVIHGHLAGEAYNPTQLLLVGYGGRVNAVAPDATATAQRDSILKAAHLGAWSSPDDDEANIALIREMYRDVYAHSGECPRPTSTATAPTSTTRTPTWPTPRSTPRGSPGTTCTTRTTTRACNRSSGDTTP